MADLTGHSGSFATADLSQKTLLLGVQENTDLRRFRPFFRAMVGLVHTSTTEGTASDSSSHLTLAGGGGVVYPLGRHWGARGQIDLLFTHGTGAWELDPRFGVGAVYRLGR